MEKETMIVSGSSLHQRIASSSKVLDTSTTEACVKDDDKKRRGTRHACTMFAVLTIFCLGVIGSESSVRKSLRSGPNMLEPRALSNKKESKDLLSLLLPSSLEPGDISPFADHLDDSQVNEHAQYVGLPPQLTTELEAFVKESGLFEAFQAVPYEENPSWETLHNQVFELKGNRRGQFAVASHDEGSNKAKSDSDIHWIDAVNEEALDETLDALERGGFDVVLEAIRTEYESNGLQVYDVDFFVVTRSSGGNGHGDDSESNDDTSTLRLMIPLFEHGNCIVPVGLSQNIGILLPGVTYYSTKGCDLRLKKGFEVAASIHLADVREDQVDSRNIPRDGVKAADWLQEEGEALAWTTR